MTPAGTAAPARHARSRAHPLARVDTRAHTRARARTATRAQELPAAVASKPTTIRRDQIVYAIGAGSSAFRPARVTYARLCRLPLATASRLVTLRSLVGAQVERRWRSVHHSLRRRARRQVRVGVRRGQSVHAQGVQEGQPRGERRDETVPARARSHIDTCACASALARADTRAPTGIRVQEVAELGAPWGGAPRRRRDLRRVRRRGVGPGPRPGGRSRRRR